MKAAVVYTQKKSVDTEVRRKSKEFMLRSALKLMELGSTKADYSNGKHSGGIPVYTGNLRSSWLIMAATPDKCIVGSNLKYGSNLIKGIPNPFTSLQDINDWVRLRQGGVDANPYGVWWKIITTGPDPNNFPSRIAEMFKLDVDKIAQEVMQSG